MQRRSLRLASLPAVALAAALAAAGCGRSEPAVREVPASSPDVAVAGAARSSDPVDASDGGGLVVDVAGLVRRPGVYRMHAGARVHEAIEAAGGARPGADLGSLNRAALVTDGQQVLVVAVGGEDPVATGSGAGSSGGISINRSDAADLEQLPGIGPVTAQRIVAERSEGGPFASVEDLERVPGIGPATIESLRDVATT